MDHVFEDYRGRRIRLTQNRREHLLEHPEMHACIQGLAETLIVPDEVRVSASDANAHLYYKSIMHPLLGPKLLCCVIKVMPGDAFIVTAYVTDKVKKGTLLWPDKA